MFLYHLKYKLYDTSTTIPSMNIMVVVVVVVVVVAVSPAVQRPIGFPDLSRSVQQTGDNEVYVASNKNRHPVADRGL